MGTKAKLRSKFMMVVAYLIDGPVSEVQKLAQQDEGTKSVLLTQQDLKHDG